MRLIDADALEGEAICLYTYGGARYIPLDALKRAPTVDAVEVVRCRDCMHDGLSTCAICYIENKTLAFINHDPDFYCAHGERKGDDTRTCEHCHHAHASTVLEDKPLFCIECEQFKSKEDTCDKWQEKHKERNC